MKTQPEMPAYQLSKMQKEKLFALSLEELEFSQRASKRLLLAGVRTVWQLTRMTKSELLALKGFGKKSVTEVEENLAKFKCFGLPLKLREDLPLNERQAQDAMHEIGCAIGLFQTTEPTSEFYATVVAAVQALKRERVFFLKREEAVREAATILTAFANQWKNEED